MPSTVSLLTRLSVFLVVIIDVFAARITSKVTLASRSWKENTTEVREVVKAGELVDQATHTEPEKAIKENRKELVDWAQAMSFDWTPCEVAPINCGQQYFHEVYQQFQTAEEVIIQGWLNEVDVPLFAPRLGDKPNITMKMLIAKAAARGAHIYYLFWKSSVSERLGFLPADGPAQMLKDISATNVHVLVDESRDFTPVLFWSAHIKVSVFDRRVGYVGGIDFVRDRLDSPAHKLPDSSRVPDEGKAFLGYKGLTGWGYGKPWQDVMAKVEGQAARDLATIAVERWWTFCESWGTSETAECSLTNWPIPDSLGSLVASFRSTMHSFTSGRNTRVQLEFEAGHEKNTWTVGSASQEFDLGHRRDFAKSLKVKVIVEKPGLLGTYAFSKPTVETFSLVDLQSGIIRKIGASTVYLRWKPSVETLSPTRNTTGHVWNNMGDVWKPRSSRCKRGNDCCRVILNGNKRWLGASAPIHDMLAEHIRLIREAKRSVYIENQYFIGHVETESESCAGMLGLAKNNVPSELYKRITSMALYGLDFSVVIVIPLSTEEMLTQYPNLRTVQCLHEALITFWEKHQIKASLSEYFGVFHLANVVEVPNKSTTSAFHGIFVHSKLIVVDGDSVDGEAIVGSANVNDRSLDGFGDAEVGVVVRGGSFPQRLLANLTRWHANFTLSKGGKLASEFSRVALANARNLNASLHIDLVRGKVTLIRGHSYMATVSNETFLNQSSNPVLDQKEASWMGNGFHWFEVPGIMKEPLQGHLFPWNKNIWGDPSQYIDLKHHSHTAWLQIRSAQRA